MRHLCLLVQCVLYGIAERKNNRNDGRCLEQWHQTLLHCDGMGLHWFVLLDHSQNLLVKVAIQHIGCLLVLFVDEQVFVRQQLSWYILL